MFATHSIDDVDATAEGRYVTDGVNLYRLLEDADEGQALVAVEDCRSLETLLMPTSDLHARMRPVEQRALSAV